MSPRFSNCLLMARQSFEHFAAAISIASNRAFTPCISSFISSFAAAISVFILDSRFVVFLYWVKNRKRAGIEPLRSEFTALSRCLFITAMGKAVRMGGIVRLKWIMDAVMIAPAEPIVDAIDSRKVWVCRWKEVRGQYLLQMLLNCNLGGTMETASR